MQNCTVIQCPEIFQNYLQNYAYCRKKTWVIEHKFYSSYSYGLLKRELFSKRVLLILMKGELKFVTVL